MTIAGISDLIIGAVNNHKVENSLRFSPEKSSYLAQSVSGGGNRKTFTFSTWIKRSKLTGVAFSLFDNGKWDVGSSQSNIRLTGDTDAPPLGCIDVYDWNGTYQWRVIAIQNRLIDTSAWMHVLVAVDTTQVTAADRVKIYVNGIRQNEFYSATYPSLNADTYFNSGTQVERTIGKTNALTTHYYDGLLAETYWIDGQALDPSAFSDYTEDSNLTPRKFNGDVGPCGFYLDYKDFANTSNRVTYSENFQANSLGWSVGAANRTANSGISPAGANTATKITSSGYATHELTKALTSGTIANNSYYTWSFYAKNTGNPTIQVIVPTAIAGGTSAAYNINTSNGDSAKVSGNANTNVNVVYINNDWWRCAVTFRSSTVSSNGTLTIRLLSPASNSTTYTANSSDGVLIWGNQINAGNTPSPYIFTSNTTITSTNLLLDKSSRGFNSFVPVNMDIGSTPFLEDQTKDSPTTYDDNGTGRGNYCQLNVNDSTYVDTILNGGTRISNPANNDSTYSSGTIAIPTSGKWYWECQLSNLSSPIASRAKIGIESIVASGSVPGSVDDWPRIYYENSGRRIILNGVGANVTAGLTTCVNNDIIGVAVDTTAGRITWYKNNTHISNLVSNTITSTQFKAGVELTIEAIADINFGRTPFTYTPPTGYLAINSLNIPAAQIIRPKDHFDIKTWSGDGANTRNITGVSFSPGLVIIKNRTSNSDWATFDIVRGVANTLFLNRPATTGGDSNQITNNANGWVSSFNSDGISIRHGANGTDTNKIGSSYISFMWKEAVSSGLDIVNWTGNAANPRNISHNLGVTPNLIIIKSVNRGGVSDDWYIWQLSLSGSVQIFDRDDIVDVASTGGGVSSANSTTFTLSGTTTSRVNLSSGTYIGYVFSDIQGYSKSGFYGGNGLTNGPFIYTGFKPALVMIKGAVTGGASTDWNVFNSRADKDSSDGAYELIINSTKVESTSNTGIWTYANGFKVPTDPDLNNGAGTLYAYMAWADVPLKYSRGR